MGIGKEITRNALTGSAPGLCAPLTAGELAALHHPSVWLIDLVTGNWLLETGHRDTGTWNQQLTSHHPPKIVPRIFNNIGIATLSIALKTNSREKMPIALLTPSPVASGAPSKPSVGWSGTTSAEC